MVWIVPRKFCLVPQKFCFVPQKLCFVCRQQCWMQVLAAPTSRLSDKPRHSSFLVTFPGAMRRRGIFSHSALCDAAVEFVLLRHLSQSLPWKRAGPWFVSLAVRMFSPAWGCIRRVPAGAAGVSHPEPSWAACAWAECHPLCPPLQQEISTLPALLMSISLSGTACDSTAETLPPLKGKQLGLGFSVV